MNEALDVNDANITFGKLSKDIYQALTDEGKGKKDFGIVF
jgi:hypothetical protein